MIETSRSICVQVAISFACHETAKIVNVAHYVFAQSTTVCRESILLQTETKKLNDVLRTLRRVNTRPNAEYTIANQESAIACT